MIYYNIQNNRTEIEFHSSRKCIDIHETNSLMSKGLFIARHSGQIITSTIRH
jgi:hypothetical protein